MKKWFILSSVLALALTACPDKPKPPTTPPPTGGGSSTVSGLLIFPGQVGNPPPAPPSPTPPSPPTPPTPPTPPPSPPPASGTFSGTVTVPNGSGGSVTDTVVFACFVTSSTSFDCNDVKSKGGKVTASGSSVNFTLSGLATVQYVVYAWKDLDGSKKVSAGDYFTFFGDDGTGLASVITPPKSGVNLPMYNVVGTASLSASNVSSIVSASRLETTQIETVQNNLVGVNTGLSNNLNAQTHPEFVPGEVIVKFRDGIRSQGISSLQAQVSGASVNIARVRSLGSALPRTELYRASTDAAGTLEMARQLSQRSDVEYAEPNYISHILKVPNDPAYAAQWHYKNMNLENAWDITTGTANPVTVAVVDTGSTNHPDLQGTFLDGYDFLTDPKRAGDNDGRDADPTDLGGESHYHGSHVAGTIAAQSNNGVGVAGVNWGAKVVPVRVLGIDGRGPNTDISDGIQWAAGIHVDGVPDNQHPAKIINLSLGGDGPCSQSDQDLFNNIKAKGVIVIVAAGNENGDAMTHNPASCNNVITVGATGPDNTRAPYSNYGPRIDVMAPGGDSTQSITVGGKTYPAGVLSTILDKQGNPVYSFYDGTSMATPHVAGLVSLMLSKDPNLSFDTVLSRLKASSTALSAQACKRPSASDCGPGLVDALKALTGTGTTPPPPGPPAPPPPTTGSSKTYVFAAKCATANDCTTFEKNSLVVAEVQATTLKVPFKLKGLSAGTYVAVGWQDINNNKDPDDGEPAGGVGPFSVGDGQDLFGLVINMEPLASTSSQNTVTTGPKVQKALLSLAAKRLRTAP